MKPQTVTIEFTERQASAICNALAPICMWLEQFCEDHNEGNVEIRSEYLVLRNAVKKMEGVLKEGPCERDLGTQSPNAVGTKP